MPQPFHEPSWARALNKYTAKLYVASIKYLDVWKPPFLCWFFPPPNSVIAAALLNLSPEYSYAHIHFLAPHSTSKRAVFKQQHVCIQAQPQGTCRWCSRSMLTYSPEMAFIWGCSPAGTSYAFERAKSIPWNSLPQNYLLAEHAPSAQAHTQLNPFTGDVKLSLWASCTERWLYLQEHSHSNSPTALTYSILH